MKKSVKVFAVLTLVACVFFVCACKNKNTDEDNVIKPTNTPDADKDDVMVTDEPVEDNKDSATVTFDFSKGSADANHEFSDYLKDNERNHDFKGGVEKIGDSDIKGYMIYAKNQGENLFMYVIMPVMLKSNLDYSVKGSFSLSSNVPSDMVSDDSLDNMFSVKAGVVGDVPNKQLDEADYYRIDINKGNGTSDGVDISTVGNIAKEGESIDESFASKSYDFKSDVITNVNGNAYIIVGVQCGENAATKVYLENLTAEFNEK